MAVKKEILLGTAVIPLKTAGFAIVAQLYFCVSADGTVSVVLNSTERVGVKCGVQTPKFYKTQSGAGCTIDTTTDAKAGIQGDFILTWMSLELYDVGLEGGLAASAESKTRNAALTCSDIDWWIYLKGFWGKNATGIFSIMGKYSSKVSKYAVRDKELFGKGDSPLSGHFHMENGEKVARCTWDAGISMDEAKDVTWDLGTKPKRLVFHFPADAFGDQVHYISLDEWNVVSNDDGSRTLTAKMTDVNDFTFTAEQVHQWGENYIKAGRECKASPRYVLLDYETGKDLGAFGGSSSPKTTEYDKHETEDGIKYTALWSGKEVYEITATVPKGYSGTLCLGYGQSNAIPASDESLTWFKVDSAKRTPFPNSAANTNFTWTFTKIDLSSKANGKNSDW